MTPPRRPPVRPKPIPRRARRSALQVKLLAHAREVLGLLVLLATLFLRERGPGLPPTVPVAKREEEAPAIWSVDTRGPDAWWGVSTASRKLPSRPFPEQKRPPCLERLERELVGGCWMPHLESPPCPAGTFEGQGMCLTPVRVAHRTPTSFTP